MPKGNKNKPVSSEADNFDDILGDSGSLKAPEPTQNTETMPDHGTGEAEASGAMSPEDELAAGITTPDPVQSKEPIVEDAVQHDTWAVLIEFRDINDFQMVHYVGKDISHFSAERLARLEAVGLAGKV